MKANPPASASFSTIAPTDTSSLRPRQYPESLCGRRVLVTLTTYPGSTGTVTWAWRMPMSKRNMFLRCEQAKRCRLL